MENDRKHSVAVRRGGYALILGAATCWGSSAVLGSRLIASGFADATMLSLTRVLFAWIVLSGILVTASRSSLSISWRDLPRFLFLGIVGIAGANFFLYYAIGFMDAAIADLIQYAAPVIVVAYMVIRGRERLDVSRVAALVMSMMGCALSLGAFDRNWAAPLTAMGSAALSALCFASVLIYGKTLSARYPVWTYLYYSLFGATLFWMAARPGVMADVFTTHPWRFAGLAAFSVVSLLIPYVLFFQGLGRVEAGKAGILSTFEPVVAAVAGWMFLGQNLSFSQVCGVVLVLGSIVIVEMSAGKGEENGMETAKGGD